MPHQTLTLRQLNRATLARQMLLERRKATLVEATAHLVALQAQVPRPPFVGLWSRVQDVRRDDIVAALLDKRLVRGTSLRGTLHVMTAGDFSRFRVPLQAALDRGVKMIGDRTDGVEMERVLTLARTFFRQPRTFDAFRDHLAEAYPTGDVRAMAYATRMLLPLLQVPTDTPWGFPAQADFIAADAWLGESKKDAAATAEDLVLRYLAAYGPATAADAQAWSGIQGLRAVFETLLPRLVSFRGERGGELFDLPDAPRPEADVPVPVRLLPEWDNSIVGRADARLLPPQHRSAVFQPGLRVLPTVLADGVVVGTWKIERRKAAAVLIVSLFGKQPARARREIEAEAEALLAFTEADAGSREVRMS